MAVLGFGLLVMSGGKASAATRCAISGGTHLDYAGLVAQTEYLDDNGNWVGASGPNMYVTVATTTNANGTSTSTSGGNVVEATSAQIAQHTNTITARYMSQSFYAITDGNTGANCPSTPGNTAVILRGDGTAGSPSTTTGSYKDWNLDCDWSAHNSYYQRFIVSAHGTPSGARAGGTWSAAVYVAPANGSSAVITFQYTQPAVIQLHVFEVDQNGNKLADIGSMTTHTCEGSDPSTGSTGYASFTVVKGGSYCIRLTGSGPSGAAGPFVRPWAEGYGTACSTAYGWNGSNPYQDGNLQDHCPQSTYECQVAGGNVNSLPQCGSNVDYDRASDTGFDFIYVMPPATCSLSANPNPVVSGASTVINWSSANATSMTVTIGASPFASGLSGSKADSPTTSTTYTGNPSGPGGGVNCSVNVTVLPPTGCAPTAGYASPNEPVTLTASGANPANPYNWSGGGSPATGTGTSFTTSFSSAGVYMVTVTNSGVSASCRVNVINKPYFRLFGGDSLAGVGFAAADGSCSGITPGPGKRQLGFVSSTTPYAGGGSADANFATGQIVDFVSGLLESGTTTPNQFAFANDAAGGTYGGDTGSNIVGQACAIDSYDRAASLTTTPIGSNPFTVPAASGNYSYTGNVVYNGGTLPTGVRATIYVKGNVFIGANTYYQNSGSGYGTDPSVIPQLKIIAQGNIYVAASVTELNGIFVAQPDGVGSYGGFYTCGFNRGGGNFTGPIIDGATGSSTNPITSSEFIGSCNSQLTIYGAVVAKDVHLLRSFGTLGGVETSGTTTNAGERFIYTPDTWFNGEPSSKDQVQSYTALPTIL